jgi:hypothetical protein
MAKKVKVYIAQRPIGIGGMPYVPGERIPAEQIPDGLVKQLVEDGTLVAEDPNQTQLAEDAGLAGAATTKVLQQGLDQLAEQRELDAAVAPADVAAVVPVVDQPVAPVVEPDQGQLGKP